jgi:hypothetical protein
MGDDGCDVGVEVVERRSKGKDKLILEIFYKITVRGW